jgi:hypothetical protein
MKTLLLKLWNWIKLRIDGPLEPGIYVVEEQSQLSRLQQEDEDERSMVHVIDGNWYVRMKNGDDCLVGTVITGDWLQDKWLR